MTDRVTGARTEVEQTVHIAPEKFWEIVTDVARIGEFSPECKAAVWLDATNPGPHLGARFAGHNDFDDGYLVEVACVVTESEPGRQFGWVVLDEHEDVERPGTHWNYRLSPTEDGGTLVRHSFRHGPGNSGLREMVQGEPPEQVAAIVAERLAQLREHMAQTIAAMAMWG